MKKNFLLTCLFAATTLTIEAALPEIATFENLDLPANSYWCGELDEEDEDFGFSTSWFSSGSFDFNNFYWPDYSTWSFFAYSSRTEKTFSSVTPDQFNSITGGGADGSSIFGIAFPASFMGYTIMEVNQGVVPTTIPGMQITNTAWVVDCILNGDGFEGPFKKGDWLKLILTGYNGDEETETIEYYLADYTSENENDHYFLDQWTWIDLSDLGEVTSVYWSIDSSKANEYGVTTPTYVCLDNVGEPKESSHINTVNSSEIEVNFIGGSKHVIVSGNTQYAFYQVSDLTGKIIENGQLTEKNTSIDLSTLTKGIYIISVTYGKVQKNLKVTL